MAQSQACKASQNFISLLIIISNVASTLLNLFFLRVPFCLMICLVTRHFQCWLYLIYLLHQQRKKRFSWAPVLKMFSIPKATVFQIWCFCPLCIDPVNSPSHPPSILVPSLRHVVIRARRARIELNEETWHQRVSKWRVIYSSTVYIYLCGLVSP